MSEQGSARDVVHFGVFELDVSAGELRKQGRKVNLQQQPFQVLALLLRRPGELVTREALQQALWPADTFVEFDQGLNTAIKKIRQALSDSADNPRFVETLPRKGYRFIAPVNGAQSAVPSSRRGGRLLWIAASLVLIVVAASAAWLLHRNPAGRIDQGADSAIAAVPLTSYPGVELYPSFSPDGNQVAFEWDGAEGPPGIYVKFVGDSEPLRLASGCCPAWSPDGRWIAFLRFEPEGGVFLISPIGGPEQKLAALDFAPDLFASAHNIAYTHRVAWHPDSQWLVLPDRASQGGPLALFALSVESREKRRLTSPPAGSDDVFPAVSPGGDALVFSRASGSAGDLYLLELAEGLQPHGEPRRLPSGNAYNSEPTWMPDGRGILFSSGATGAPQLYQMALASPGWRPSRAVLRAFAGVGARMPALSPQGRLAYALQTCGANIWRLELNAQHRPLGPPKGLAPSTRHDYVPAYSPDGQRIAFTSNRSGSREIWVCNRDGSGLMKLTSMGGTGHTGEPRWSSNGRLITFGSDASGREMNYFIDANGSKPAPLCADCESHLLSQDGKWLYYTAHDQVWKRRWSPSGPAGEAVQITHRGGEAIAESPDGKTLYLAKGQGEECGSLWRVPVDGGEEAHVLDSFCCLNVAVADQGIYFIAAWRRGERPSIQYLDFASGKTETIASLSYEASWGMAVSPDGRSLLYTQYENMESDLSLVENFR